MTGTRRRPGRPTTAAPGGRGARSAALALVALLAVLAVAGCSGGSGGGDAGAAEDFGPVEAPGGWQVLEGGAVSVAVPEGFEEVPGGPEGRLQAAGPPDADGLSAAVVVEVAESDRDAEADAENLAEVVREVNGADDVDVLRATWSGEPAWLVRWEGPAQTGSDVVVRSSTLVADVDGGVLTATAQAPPEAFDALDLERALRTVRVAGAAS